MIYFLKILNYNQRKCIDNKKDKYGRKTFKIYMKFKTHHTKVAVTQCYFSAEGRKSSLAIRESLIMSPKTSINVDFAGAIKYDNGNTNNQKANVSL